MAQETVAVLGFVALFVLMLLRVPIGVAMGVVGVTGFGYLAAMNPALNLLAQSPIRVSTDWDLAIVPMFILMGAFATASGMSRELFDMSNAWLGHRRGGLAMATVAACASFSAINGSSVATAATMTKVALPEMRRAGYDPGFATGVIAAGGTLGIMIPPSVMFAIYGVLTEQDISRLLIAGILPGLLGALLYMAAVQVVGIARPGQVPRGPRASWGVRLASLRDIWAMLLLFGFVIGGLYGGLFTATEAAGMGAGGAFLIGVARRRLSLRTIVDCLVQSVRTTAAIFTIVIGAFLFGYFLVITQTTQNVTAFMVGLPIDRYAILGLILLMYLVLGAIMDALAMVLLTIPIVFPVIVQLGFDPIWFGVIVVMMVELALIVPPIGMNVFVINSIARDVSLPTIYKGVAPFIAADIVRLTLLVAFPAISLFLPGKMG
ncbi:MAG: TRAP transporter large permease [Xanthobacteraceae bacterium]|nr:TRAP transporter large permease [Xanthobacteraceae bacterium]